MEKTITFRHMEHSAVMDNYINQQLVKIEKLLEHEQEPIFLDSVLEPSKVHAHHSVELRIKTPHEYLIAKHEGPNFYEVLDHVIDTMYEQVCEKKRERVDKKKKGEGWFKGA
jgi:ribosomal subunit interface protein